LEKLRVTRYYVIVYENEKDELWAMLEEEKVNIHREKDQGPTTPRENYIQRSGEKITSLCARLGTGGT
jgi:hypothetical protein